MSDLALASDCSSCFGLCCVLLPFRRESGFGADKDGGTPCTNLLLDDGCGIHDDLRGRGWPGCTVFECFGAGQHVSQGTYGGTSWRESDNLGEMAAVLSAMRQLHEMLFHLAEVARRSATPAAHALAERITALSDGDAGAVLGIDVEGLLGEVGGELRAASLRLRGHAEGGRDTERADLSGRDLRDVPLAGVSLRGSLLLGVDLRRADLSLTDLLGADVRGADLRGADLSEALFVTQPQVNGALGDPTTQLPDVLSLPGHWV